LLPHILNGFLAEEILHLGVVFPFRDTKSHIEMLGDVIEIFVPQRFGFILRRGLEDTVLAATESTGKYQLRAQLNASFTGRQMYVGMA
jgi:hypothetical protein